MSNGCCMLFVMFTALTISQSLTHVVRASWVMTVVCCLLCLYENASFIIVSTIVDSLRIFNFHTDFCDMNWRYLNIALVPTGTSLQGKEIELSLPVAGYNVLVRKGHVPVMWDEWNTRSAFRTERKWKPYVWKMSYSLHEHTACSRSYSTMVISWLGGYIKKTSGLL